ncbi:MAG: Gfo/Idh/MocA family oxidoreductase [Pseudomonadota bacterium]
MNRNSIGFAIVGCGRIGTRHAGFASKLGNLHGVCDIVPTRAETIANDTGADAFTDFETMLERLKGQANLVSVCTPNGLHAEHTIKAFEHGYHVLCEKPMALSVHDCGEMIKAGERANKRLFVVKQNRYNPPVEHLKALIDTGKLGRIYSVHLNCFWNRNDNYYKSDWKGTKALDGGTLYTQFSHFVDLLYWLAGDVRDVQAFTENYTHQHSIEFEDSGVAILRFHSGAIGTVSFTINSYNKNMEGSLTLFCEKGTIKIGGQYLNEIEYENIEGMAPSEIAEGRSANEYGDYQGSMSNHEDVYNNVLDVLTSGGSISTVGFEGLKTVEIIDKIYRAVARAA